MSGYKLADGTYSSDYKIGDKFEAVDGIIFQKGSIVTYTTNDNSDCPWFTNKYGREYSCMWFRLKSYKEPVKQFTKSGLLDGMRVVYRNGYERIYINGRLYDASMATLYERSDLSEYNQELKHEDEYYMDIMKVTDRDGTVLFTREEPKVEPPTKSPAQIELEKLQEQIAQLQEQADKLQSCL